MVAWTDYDTYTLTWTEQIVADNVTPDVDTAISIAGAERICCEWDTTNASTDAPNFDFHLHASIDGVLYGANIHKTLKDAVAENVVGIANFGEDDFGPTFIKARLDVNNDALAAAEYVTLRITVYW